MFSDLLKASLIVLVGFGLYANWDKISSNNANASTDQTRASQHNEEDSYPVLSLDEFNCWFMDTIVETSGTITNLTHDSYSDVSLEIALLNNNGDTMRHLRMKASPSQIAANRKINFKTMYIIGKLKPASCRLTNILISGKDELEPVLFEANCTGCETI